MKSLYFDLVAPSRGRWHLRWALALLGAVGLLGTLAQWRLVTTPQLLAQRQLVQEQRARMGSEQPVARMKPAEMTQAWQRAQAVSQQLQLPWSRFFLSLGQTSTQSQVALISIEPDAQKGQLVVLAEARNMGAMLKFVSALQDSAGFSGVTLQSHLINRALPEKPIRFRLNAKWSTTDAHAAPVSAAPVVTEPRHERLPVDTVEHAIQLRLAESLAEIPTRSQLRAKRSNK